MPYLLDGSAIRAPMKLEERNSSQTVTHRTLDGTISRDTFGDNKRSWILTYRNTNVTAYAVIKAIYDAYLDDNAPVTWQVTEPNYTVGSTNVHVDLLERNFTVRGTDYISDFDLILTEA